MFMVITVVMIIMVREGGSGERKGEGGKGRTVRGFGQEIQNKPTRKSNQQVHQAPPSPPTTT